MSHTKTNTKMKVMWSAAVAAMLIASAACTDPGAGEGDDDPGPGPGPGSNTAVCGNKTCEATETAQSCPADCGPQTVCGNTVCESGEAQSCPADCPASLRMQNNSSYTIYELYAKRCSDTAWGPDQTGANYVLSGNAFTLTGIPPGCYHFRAVSGSHYWLTQEGVDLSANEIYPWTLVN